jgi:hypothetical protein
VSSGDLSPPTKDSGVLFGLFGGSEAAPDPYAVGVISSDIRDVPAIESTISQVTSTAGLALASFSKTAYTGPSFRRYTLTVVSEESHQAPHLTCLCCWVVG